MEHGWTELAGCSVLVNFRKQGTLSLYCYRCALPGKSVYRFYFKRKEEQEKQRRKEFQRCFSIHNLDFFKSFIVFRLSQNDFLCVFASPVLLCVIIFFSDLSNQNVLACLVIARGL